MSNWNVLQLTENLSHCSHNLENPWKIMFTTLWKKRKRNLKIKLHTLPAIMKIAIFLERKNENEKSCPIVDVWLNINEFACKYKNCNLWGGKSNEFKGPYLWLIQKFVDQQPAWNLNKRKKNRKYRQNTKLNTRHVPTWLLTLIATPKRYYIKYFNPQLAN